jgi:hypothetical protein
MLLRNRLYAGIVDVPEYRVPAQRGDFEPVTLQAVVRSVSGESVVFAIGAAAATRATARAARPAEDDREANATRMRLAVSRECL